MKAERKYLERHAETETRCVADWPEGAGPYAHVVAVPAYGEDQCLLDMLASVPACEPSQVLVILVVNQRESAPDWASLSNRSLLARLRDGATTTHRLAQNIELLRGMPGDLLLVDRTQPGYYLPPKQGVGLARKIGSDIALQLHAEQRVVSPWIHCTDADALLPDDYFSRAASQSSPSREIGATPIAGLVYDFRHDFSREADGGLAILRYEIFLRYYVLGLRSATSPYAFHTIGSTIAIRSRAYAQVRGFPRRQAAEDFHLLAKLAKVGRIQRLSGAPIVLSARGSDRVPFGTGAAVNKERARQEHGTPFPAYDPRIFCWLRVWLRAMRDLADPNHSKTDLHDHLKRRAAEEPDVEVDVLRSLLGQMDAIEAAKKAVQRQGDITRSLNESFDALKTLRFVHALRDLRYPDIPLERAIREAPFLELDRDQRDFAKNLESICLTLARHEAVPS